MARGDVLWIELPNPQGGSGHEQAGRRPAVVVQADNPGSLSTIMIVPFTGQLAAGRFPYTIQVDPSAENGLASPSVLLVFQLRAIDKRRILQKAGTLEQKYVDRLDQMLLQLLDIQ